MAIIACMIILPIHENPAHTKRNPLAPRKLLGVVICQANTPERTITAIVSIKSNIENTPALKSSLLI